MRYEVICPVCNYKFYAAPSIGQRDFGMDDMGHGSCPGCKTFLNLSLDSEHSRMTARVFDEWLKERNERKAAANET